MSEALTDRRRRRRQVVLLAGLAGAVLLMLGAWLWLAAFRLSAEERRLVGFWRVEGTAVAGGRPVVIEFEYLADHTRRARHLDPESGSALTGRAAHWGERWRLAGGRLETYWLRNPLPPRLGGSGVLAEAMSSYALAWDGPDRFRLTDTADSLSAATWERVR